MKRSFCMLLCAVLLIVCLPVTASANSRYSTVSTLGEALQYPASQEYLSTPLRATVQAKRGICIYFMPLPEKGHGNLGTVANGTTVTILAETRYYYFFSTDDGRVGWNGKDYFNVSGNAPSIPSPAPTAPPSGYLFYFSNGGGLTIPTGFSYVSDSSADNGGMLNTFYYNAARDYSMTLTEISFNRYRGSAADVVDSVYNNLVAANGNNVTDAGTGGNEFWMGSYYGPNDMYFLVAHGYYSASALYVIQIYYPSTDYSGYQMTQNILNSFYL